MKKFALTFCLGLLPVVAFAQVIEPSLSDLFTQLWAIISNWGLVGPLASISAISFFLVATMKNSFIRQYGWDKLGTAKVFVAPALSLIGTLILVHPITFANVGIALLGGIGAIAINELLNAVKEIPGIKPLWITIVDLIQKILGAVKPVK